MKKVKLWEEKNGKKLNIFNYFKINKKINLFF